MLTLAIETSSANFSVALFRQAECLAQRSGGPRSGMVGRGATAADLHPEIRDLLSEQQTDRRELSLIAVSVGPGSFTGLRIGVTAAKTLSLALQIPLTGINTLHAIAEQAHQALADITEGCQIVVAANAQRRQLFTQSFRAESNGELTANSDVEIRDRADWLAGLQVGDFVTGPGLGPLSEPLGELPIHLVDSEFWYPQARSIGKLAIKKHSSGQVVDELWSVQPLYFRPSYAEETREPRS